MRKILLFVLVNIAISYSANAQREFWGSASFGGVNNAGFIFRTDSIGNNLEIVHHFKKEIDGENISALTLASNHKLYGVASAGGQGGTGAFSSGTLFEYDLATKTFRVLEHFGPSNTKLPIGMTTPRAEGVPNLIEISPGVLLILFYQGHHVYAYDVATGTFTKPFTIPTYQGGATNGTLQNVLNQGFRKSTNGFLYATTQTNSMCPIGNPNMGSIIRVNPANNTISIIHKASCLVENGYTYNGFSVEVNGKMYATTSYGGTNNKGVFYEFNLANNTFAKLHDFSGSVYSFEPTSLVYTTNGKFYGTAHGGGTPEPNLGLNAGGGCLFEFDITTNTFTKKHDFTIAGQSIYDMGIFPSGLIQSLNGKLYGATQYGVFEYDPATESIRVAGRFEGIGFAPSFLQLCRKPAYQIAANTTYSICEGESFTLDLLCDNATSVSWTHNSNIDASRTTPVLTFNSFSSTDAGTWVCSMTNECGVTVAQSITLTSGTPSKPAVVVEGELTFCEGNSVMLSVPTQFDHYTWSTGATTQQITVNESGTYNVTVGNNCESPTSDDVTVVVYGLPDAPTSIQSSNETLTAIGGSGSTYQWLFNDVIIEDHNAQIEAATTGNYKVYSLSEHDCRSTGFAVIDYVVTDIESTLDGDIDIYPNPTQGILQLTSTKTFSRNVEIQLINTLGEVALHKTEIPNTDTIIINVADIPPGLYTLFVEHESQVKMKKVVIR